MAFEQRVIVFTVFIQNGGGGICGGLLVQGERVLFEHGLDGLEQRLHAGVFIGLNEAFLGFSDELVHGDIDGFVNAGIRHDGSVFQSLRVLFVQGGDFGVLGFGQLDALGNDCLFKHFSQLPHVLFVQRHAFLQKFLQIFSSHV